MKTRFLVVFMVLILLFTIGTSVQASNRQPGRGYLLFNNILNGAAAGMFVGISGGLIAYGNDHGAEPQVLLTGPIYGFLGGAIVGTGLGLYQFTTPNMSSGGYPIAEYVAGGTLSGMFIGAMVATIAWARYDDEDFNAEIGWGGVGGAILGVGLVFLDIATREPEPGGDMLLSGEIGIRPLAGGLASLIPEIPQEPNFACQMVRIDF